VSPGQQIPPEYDKGDERTVGGYAAVHARPAALEGRDGMSYSLDVLSDTTDDPDPDRVWGGYLVFVQWTRTGAQQVAGHLETPFLTFGEDAESVVTLLGELTLEEAQRILDNMLLERDGASSRRWWDVMRDERGEHESHESAS
jgi:hypothetical protein